MKRYFAILLAALMLLSAGCSKKAAPILPEVEQIRSICQLTTLKCYYNNVAKTTLSADHFWEKDRELWIEYEGVAIIGIDMNKGIGDIIAQLKGKELGERLLLPQNILRSGEDVFLDDIRLPELEKSLQVVADIVKSSGYDFIDEILKGWK